MTTIIAVGVVMLVIGSVFGLTLWFADKKFYVKVNPKTSEVEEILPGANCGACGFTGCPKYAEAVAESGADVNLCSPGGEDTAKIVAGIMGIEAEKKDRKVAVLMCSAKNVSDVFDYNGPQNCVSANLVQGGSKACEFGCIGLGDCADVCQFGAITMDKNGLPHINEDKCTACGKCVEICPKGLFQILPAKKKVHVRCKNLDKGKIAKTKCDNPCIACKKCEKVCKFDAIKVINNLAVIDYDKCTACGKCVEVCPTLIIRNYRKGQTAEVARRLQEEAKKKAEEAQGPEIIGRCDENKNK